MERKGAYRVLVGKSEGNRPLGRPKPRLGHNTKMDFQEVEWEVWTRLIWLTRGTGGRLL